MWILQDNLVNCRIRFLTKLLHTHTYSIFLSSLLPDNVSGSRVVHCSCASEVTLKDISKSVNRVSFFVVLVVYIPSMKL